MAFLVVSIVVLALGPLLHRLARERAGGLALLDGFIVVAIAGLVLLGVLPESVHKGGWWAVLACALGLFGPTMVERLFHGAVHQTHNAALTLALLGLAVHAGLDGVALHAADGGVDAGGHSHLPLAVILHRLPVGLTIWWLLRPIGAAAASGVLGLLAAATTTGFFLGPQLLVSLEARPLAWFEALVAGSLLHVILHRYPAAPSPHAADGPRWFEGSGALVGLGFLTAVLGRELWLHGDPMAERVAQTFLSLALDSAGPLVLAYLMAGAVTTFLGPSSVDWMRRGGAWSQSLRGMVIGLPFPVCSCGVVPIYRAFIRRGVPATAAMAFFVATPELGLDAVLLSVPLLGVPMTILRVAAAATVALLVGWFVGRAVPAVDIDDAGDCCDGENDLPFRDKLRASFRWGFGEVVDNTAGWILVGLVVAAMIHPFLELEWLRSLPAGIEVLLFALLGLPTYVCASGATPLVAVLVASGVSPGAALAFLLTGPATNLTTFGVLSRLHGYRTAWTFATAVAGLAVLVGLLVNGLAPGIGAGAVDPTAAEPASPLKWIALGLLALIYTLSLLRNGARRFFVENLLPDPHAGHAHDSCS